ncbi:MAG: hypothetical protein WC538_21365 [Thermoanaerobaculia bacterium]|jgi:hypothetical protein
MPDDAQRDLPSDPSATFNPDITDILAGRDDPRTTPRDAMRTLPRWDVATPDRGPGEASERPRFVLHRRAGFGGYGEVWEATQSSLNRVVAVKVIRENLRGEKGVGWAERSLGNAGDALRHFEQQRALMFEVTRREPTNSNWQRELAFSEAVIGRMRRASGDTRGAVASLESSRDILRDWARRDPSNSAWRRDAAVSQTLLAQARWAAGDRPTAVSEMTDAASTLDALAKSDPSNSGWARDLAQTHRFLGPMLSATGDATRGRDELEKAASIMEPLTRDLKASPPPFLDTRASALLLLGRTAEAKPIVARLAEIGWSDPDYAAMLRETRAKK